MTASVSKPYAALPDYADVDYVDGKLRVASGIARRATDPERRRKWLETADILLDQRNALAALNDRTAPSTTDAEPIKGATP